MRAPVPKSLRGGTKQAWPAEALLLRYTRGGVQAQRAGSADVTFKALPRASFSATRCQARTLRSELRLRKEILATLIMTEGSWLEMCRAAPLTSDRLDSNRRTMRAPRTRLDSSAGL